MNEPQEKELNILILGYNQEFKKVYDEGLKQADKELPKINIFVLINNFEEEIQKIKDIKLDIICAFPFFSQYVEFALKNFPTIKWVHSLAAGVERFLKLDAISKNDKLIFSNSKGAYSEAFGGVGITSLIYFSYNIYSYTEYMKNKEWTRPRNKSLFKKNFIDCWIWK